MFRIFLFISSHPTQVLVIVIFHRKRRNTINAVIQKGSVEGNGRFFFPSPGEGRKYFLLLCFYATKPYPGEMEIQTMGQPQNNKNDVAYKSCIFVPIKYHVLSFFSKYLIFTWTFDQIFRIFSMCNYNSMWNETKKARWLSRTKLLHLMLLKYEHHLSLYKKNCYEKMCFYQTVCSE